MKLSVITVVYNNIKTIGDAIDSVLGQYYTNIEYIIVDGASEDGTLQVVHQYKDRISIVISEPDKGIYDAMNKGIRAATGDVIGILNSDDIYANAKVTETIMNVFNQEPSVDIVYGDLVYVKSDNIFEVVRNWKSSSYYNRFFENGNVPPHPSLFVKRNVYKEVGLFNLNFKLAADYEIMLRIFKKYKFNSKYISETIVRMRLGGATNQSCLNIVRQNLEILRAWNQNDLKAPFLLMPLRFCKRIRQYFK